MPRALPPGVTLTVSHNAPGLLPGADAAAIKRFASDFFSVAPQFPDWALTFWGMSPNVQRDTWVELPPGVPCPDCGGATRQFALFVKRYVSRATDGRLYAVTAADLHSRRYVKGEDPKPGTASPCPPCRCKPRRTNGRIDWRGEDCVLARSGRGFYSVGSALYWNARQLPDAAAVELAVRAARDKEREWNGK